jgi:hypothetical protein
VNGCYEVTSCYGSQWLLWKANGCYGKHWLLWKVNGCFEKSNFAAERHLLLLMSMVAMKSQWLQ